MAKKPYSVQTHQDVEPQIGSLAFPLTFISGMDIAPEWEAVDRDAYLRLFWKKFGQDMLQSVLATAIAKVVTQNWEIEGPEKVAEMYKRLIRDEADFGHGYDYMVGRGLIDYYTQDNGWFMERQRSGPRDHKGPMMGLAHLDSARMRATGNTEYPWTYQDIYGEFHLMHRSQLIRIVDMPTPETALYHNERGFCALSRVLSTAMIMTMLVAMKRERLADLPPSALAIFNNINRKQFNQALSLKGAEDDMANNMIYRQLLPLFGIDPAHPASVQFLSLREVWEGYDDETQFNLAAYSYAAGFRMDPREFWPVSQGPLGTGKEAEVQHQKAKAKSHGLIFTAIERSWNSDDSLPPEVMFRYRMQDIDEEEQRASIHRTQIDNIKGLQDAGAGLTAEEVRYLAAIQYRVLPRIMVKVPEEGAKLNLASSDMFIDDVERQAKEFNGWWFGPRVIIDNLGKKEYMFGNPPGFGNAPLYIGLDTKGGAGSGNWGHAGRPGLRGGSAPRKGFGAVMSITSGPTAAQRQLEATNQGTIKNVAGEERTPSASDVLDLKASSDTPTKVMAGEISSGVGDYMMRTATYDALQQIPKSGRAEYVKSTYTELARQLGIDTDIQVVSDADFNRQFSGAKVSDFGQMMGGVAAVTAGYRADQNIVYIRQRNVEAAGNSPHEYMLLRNSLFHEFGHAYHATVWDIKLQDKGKYGSGWCEQFAESFSVPLSFGVKAMQAVSIGKATTPKLMELYRNYDLVQSLRSVINDNGPKGGKEFTLSQASKEQLACCESHAAQAFPDLIDAMRLSGLIDFDMACKASMLPSDQAYRIAQAAQTASRAGQDYVDGAAKELKAVVATHDYRLGDKAARGLKTINQKISTLPGPQAHQTREAAKRIQAALDPSRRTTALKEIPDDVWDYAVAQDEQDNTNENV